MEEELASETEEREGSDQEAAGITKLSGKSFSKQRGRLCREAMSIRKETHPVDFTDESIVEALGREGSVGG